MRCIHLCSFLLLEKAFKGLLGFLSFWIYFISVCLSLNHKALSESPPAFITNELLCSGFLGYCDANCAAWSTCAEAGVRAQVFNALYNILILNINIALQRIMCLSSESHFRHQVGFLLYLFSCVVAARLSMLCRGNGASFGERWEFKSWIICLETFESGMVM